MLAKPPSPKLSRAEWVAEFANVARELWPEIGLNHANRVGLSRWVSGSNGNPAEAARRWIEETKRAAG